MILDQLKQLLEKQEFECTIILSSSIVPLDRLLVYLGTDAKKRERMVEIISHQIEIPAEFARSDAPTLPCNLNFRSELPFKVNDMSLSQVGSLILFINQFLELPGFELNELEGKVIYRYVWMMQQPSIDSPPLDSTLLMTIIGAIMLNLSLFAEMIESLAEGQMTFNDLLKKIVAMGKNP